MKLDGKPDRGSFEEATLLAEFFTLSRELNWHQAFRKLGQETLVVIDPKVREALEADYGSLDCHVRMTGMLRGVPEGVSRILFLCRNHEWKRTKAARKRYPKVAVLSLIYDIAPMGVLSSGVFPDNLERAIQPSLKAPRNILLCIEGSDSEYLDLMLQKNRMQSFTPFAGRAVAIWVLLSAQFHVVRFAAQALAYAKLRGEALHIDMSLLQLFFQHTPLKHRRCIDWFDANRARVLYFYCRDKSRQAGLLQMMEKSVFSSLWDSFEANAKEISDQRFDKSAALSRVAEIVKLEISLEPALQNIASFKMMTLEDLVVTPEAILIAISQFWGDKAPPRRIREIDWRARYNAFPDFLAQLSVLRVDIADIYGLEDMLEG